MPTPAEVVQAFIVASGIAAAPGVEQQPDFGPVQCFVGELGNEIDRAMAVIDSAGSLQGRSQRTGRSLKHPGLKVMFRSPEYNADPLYQVEALFNNAVSLFNVRVAGFDYHVLSVYCTSDVISLGEDKATKRYQWILNARIVFQEPSRTTVED